MYTYPFNNKQTCTSVLSSELSIHDYNRNKIRIYCLQLSKPVFLAMGYVAIVMCPLYFLKSSSSK